jgi:hypothetical protein
VAWSNPGNIVSDNGSNATASLPKGDSSTRLRATFSTSLVPAGSTIDGIEVRIQASVNTGSADTGIDEIIVGKSNGTLGNDLGNGATITTTPTNYTFVSSTELWGLSRTAAEINSGTFQFLASFVNGAISGTRIVSVDVMSVNIHYTPPIGGDQVFIIG